MSSVGTRTEASTSRTSISMFIMRRARMPPEQGGKPRQAGPEPILIDALRHFGEEPSRRSHRSPSKRSASVKSRSCTKSPSPARTPGASVPRGSPAPTRSAAWRERGRGREGALGVGRGEENAHRASVGDPERAAQLDASRHMDGTHVVHPLLERRSTGPGSDPPVPRLSNVITRACELRRSETGQRVGRVPWWRMLKKSGGGGDVVGAVAPYAVRHVDIAAERVVSFGMTTGTGSRIDTAQPAACEYLYLDRVYHAACRRIRRPWTRIGARAPPGSRGRTPPATDVPSPQ